MTIELVTEDEIINLIDYLNEIDFNKDYLKKLKDILDLVNLGVDEFIDKTKHNIKEMTTVIFYTMKAISTSKRISIIGNILLQIIKKSNEYKQSFKYLEIDSSNNQDTCDYILEWFGRWSNNDNIFTQLLSISILLIQSELDLSIKDKDNATVITNRIKENLLSTNYTEITLNSALIASKCALLFVKHKQLRVLFREANLLKTLHELFIFICTQPITSNITQLTYNCLFICWICSFEMESQIILLKLKLPSIFNKLLQQITNEKCLRVVLLISKNLLNSTTTTLIGDKTKEISTIFASDMIGVGWIRILQLHQKKKFGDDDIKSDITIILAILDRYYQCMTSFSEYKGELESQILEWSPAHSSEKFWKENITLFDKNNYEIISLIIQLLDSHSDKTKSIACHDIGQIIKYHPNGRLILSLPILKNPKIKLMQLMSNENAEVAQNALLAVQKIILR